MNDLDLVNAALRLVGENRIETLDNTVNSALISTANEFLPRVKAACLRAHDWNCARRRRALVAVTNDSLEEWAYAYRVPVDCLAVRRFVGSDDFTRGASFAVELGNDDESILYCNVVDAKIVYTAEFTNVGGWDSLLYDACSARLALEFAATFAREIRWIEAMWKLWIQKTDEAVGVNSSEGGDERLYSNALAEVR